MTKQVNAIAKQVNAIAKQVNAITKQVNAITKQVNAIARFLTPSPLPSPNPAMQGLPNYWQLSNR
ncbi:hypothetical protein [Nostoc sp.]|uniref:hypothetical protein n=1 Tax=Nostoc sp. TaxID=1180 RepID=UPI003FA5E91B